MVRVQSQRKLDFVTKCKSCSQWNSLHGNSLRSWSSVPRMLQPSSKLQSRQLKQQNSAGNQCPYFEVKKKQHGLFKSTENHILACSLHCQLNAPLIRFQKHLHLICFFLFLHNALFVSFVFFTMRHVYVFWKACSLCMCSLKFSEF